MGNFDEKYNKISQEWKNFISTGLADSTIISKPILDSWKRCRRKGMCPYTKASSVVLQEEKLKELLDQNKELIDICLPFMKNLHNFVKDSGFVVALSDSEGYLLEIVGDRDIVANIKRGNFIVGACWNEETTGTNGIGTVLKLGRPMQVFAYEHYCICSHSWTCSGAPIHNPNGEIIGIIDMTGPHSKVNSHTLGMVVAAANAIDNLLCLKDALTACQVANNFQETVLRSIPESLIALDNKHVITLINKNAQKIFNLHPDSILGKHIEDIFDSKNETFLSIATSSQSTTDVEVRIFKDGNYSDYTLTCNTILSTDKRVAGKILILNEIKRAKNLVVKMTGARARFCFKDIVGNNASFLNALGLAKMASENISNVLLLGESGTGKDIFAQAIHNNSNQSRGPYVAINCAAVPRDLIASELFGYAGGAFTGSKKGGNPGKFELADEGTIFLDEIGEMPMELQTTLLRVIEEKTITRIGGRNVRPVNVRIIAATNKNLRDEVRKGNFREDLYYRLDVFTITIPPLRERKSDIPLLADCFIKSLNSKMGKSVNEIDERALKILMDYSWPGNVRELQNVIERAINIAQSDILTADILSPEITDHLRIHENNQENFSLEDVERQTILRMMNFHSKKADLAKKLKISRSTLYRKLDKYNIS